MVRYQKSTKYKGIIMIKRVLISLVLLFCFAGGCRPEMEVNGRAEAENEQLFDFREVTLDNGLRVITLEDFSTPIVSVQVWYHVGSKNEDPQRQGFAHMFEHMMFKGTDRVGPKDHFEMLRSVGAQANGYTSFDKTVYLETLPADQVELALWLEAERMAFLKVDQEAVNTERRVVEEELRMRENEPYGNVFKKAAAALFEKHPYRWTPIGRIEDLRASSPAEMRAFWKRYYVPNNAALLIVGAIEHEKAQDLAEKYFGWIKRRPEPPRVNIQEPEPTEPRQLVITDELAPAPLAGIVWRTVPHGHPDETPLDFIAQILGEGSSSRLYRELVAEKQTAATASAFTYNLEDDGIFAAGALLSPSGNTDDILASVRMHLDAIRSGGISPEELEKARNNLLKSTTAQNLTVENKATQLGTAYMIRGDTDKANDILERIRSVTDADIRRAAGQYLIPQRSMTVIVEKNLEGKKDLEPDGAIAQEEEVSPPPGRSGEARPERFPEKPPIKPVAKVDVTPKYSEKTLENGLKVITVSNHEMPFVSVMLGLPYGAWCEEKPGTASLTYSMLTRGTEQYSEAELARETALRGISIIGKRIHGRWNGIHELSCRTFGRRNAFFKSDNSAPCV